MDETDKKDLINAVNESVKGLHQGIDMHRCLVASILEQRVDQRNLQTLFSFCSSRSREEQLKEAIKEEVYLHAGRIFFKNRYNSK
ncbi:MAG: hypothetical protein KAR13_22515 [Desulfobulbaceae bacterium]|nr:hypothetical protein [Desulfobulbaceae bacterium]